MMKESGKTEWRFYSPSDISIVGKALSGKLICRAADHLVAVDIRNGLPVWRRQFDLAIDSERKGPSISVVSDIIAVGDKAGELHLLQGKTGSRFGGLKASKPFPRLLSKGTRFYYVISSDSLICYDPATNAIEWTFEPLGKNGMEDRTTNVDDWVADERLPKFKKPSPDNPSHVEWVEYDRIEEFEGSRLVLSYIEWSTVWWYEADDSFSRANIPRAELTVLEATTGIRIASLNAYAWPGEASKWQKIDNSQIALPEQSGIMTCMNILTEERTWSYTHQWRKLKYDGLFGHEFATTTQIHDGKVLCVFDGQEIVVLEGKSGILEQVIRPPSVGEMLCFKNGPNSILVNYKFELSDKGCGLLSAYDLRRGGQLWELEIEELLMHTNTKEWQCLGQSEGQLVLVKMGKIDDENCYEKKEVLVLDPWSGEIRASNRFERPIDDVRIFGGMLFHTYSNDDGQITIEARRLDLQRL